MTQRMHRFRRPAAWMTAVVLTAAVAARADDAGITVNGTGEAKAKPTSVELNATVAADAELTADAVLKFNDTRKKALAALNGLKLPGFAVEAGGMTIAAAVDPSVANRGIGSSGTTAAPKTRVAEDLKLVLTGIDKLTPQAITDAVMKLIDTGHDAGLAVGPKVPTNYYEFQNAQGQGFAIAQFRLDDTAALRDRAYQAAMKDARDHAEKLADLAGVKLQSVLSVRDASPNGGDQSDVPYAFRVRTADGKAKPTSPNLDEIAVKVSVTVQYKIEPK